MSNYQSIPRRFSRPTSSINHAYIDATLKDKQRTIDSNFGLLQDTVTKTLGQDFARDQDSEMLKNKVQGVLNTLDRTDEIRFDSSKARFSIQGALSKAAKDPEVLKQVANTKKIRQVQEFYKGREKKGDLNQQNFNYAYTKSGINQYMSGASDDVGSFNYSEYVDVDAKMDEVARKLKAANPNEEVSIQNPLTGKTVSKKVSQITPEEMRNYLRVQLNSNDLKQMEIDGAMMYGMDNGAAVSYRDTLIQKNNVDYADKISKLENMRDNGNVSQGQVAQINEQIKSLGAEKSMYERRMIGNKTAEAIGGQQLIENKVNLYSSLYTKNGPESVKYDTDALKRLRDANATAALAPSGYSNPNISTITTATNLPEGVDPYKDALSRVDKVLDENSNYLKSSFTALNDNQKELVNDTMEDIKSDPEFLAMFKGQTISDETLQLETINRLGPNFFPPDVANELRSRISSTKAIQEGRNKLTNDFVTSVASQEEVFDQLYNEETALTMVTPKGEVNIQKFLKNNGVSDLASYRSFISGNSKEAKQLRATVSLQSMSLTNDVGLSDFSLVPTGAGLLPAISSGVGSTNKIDLSESEYRIMRNSVHDLTGESLEESYFVEKDGEDYTLTRTGNNTKFSKVVEDTNRLYQSGRVLTNPFGADRTIRNESSVRDLFKEDNYRNFATNNMDYLDNTVAGSNSIRIKGDEKKEVDPIYEEILQYSDNATFDKRLPIDVYKREDGSLIVSQIVKDETATTNEESKESRKVRSAVVQANDVPKMRLFNNQITLQQKETSFKTLENISGKVDKMTFIGNNNEQVDGLNRLYDRNNGKEDMFRLMSAHKTARDIIFPPSDDKYINATVKGQQIRAQFEDFVTNTQDYSLKFSKGIDTDYQVIINNKDGEEVGSIPISKEVPVETFEKVYNGTPQAFLAMYSKSQVYKYKNSIINGR